MFLVPLWSDDHRGVTASQIQVQELTWSSGTGSRLLTDFATLRDSYEKGGYPSEKDKAAWEKLLGELGASFAAALGRDARAPRTDRDHPDHPGAVTDAPPACRRYQQEGAADRALPGAAYLPNAALAQTLVQRRDAAERPNTWRVSARQATT